MVKAAAIFAMMLAAAPLAYAPASTGDTGAKTQAAPNLCKANEQPLYSCNTGRRIGSICGDKDRVVYRFGTAQRVELELTPTPQWDNVRVGTVVGQGRGGFQEHVRFSSGPYHYVLYHGQNGELTDTPGHIYSGISVLKGQRTLSSLSCTAPAFVAPGLSDQIRSRAPAHIGDMLTEEEGSFFDGWF